MTPDKGPWSVQVWDDPARPNYPKVYLMSDDFTHDVGLIVTGDFGTLEDKIAYAKDLAARMNQMPGTP